MTAFHANTGQCIGCHIEHQGVGVRAIAMGHAVLAWIGWQKTEASGSSTASQNAGTSALSEIGHFLAGITGEHPAAAEALDCFICHSYGNPHHDGTPVGCCGPGSAGSVESLFGRECANCHKTATWKIAGYQHPSPQSEDCAQCHQAPPSHYMGHFEMVSERMARQPHARVEQCYLCHRTDAWNDIKGVGWYKHH